MRFKVLENFRGLPSNANTVDLDITPPFGMCSPIPYFRGRKYLVFPFREAAKLHDGNCFQGRDIEMVPDDVRQVRDYFSGRMLANVLGQVGMAAGFDWIPIPGVRISTSRGPQTYSALSDSEGRYELRLPAAGTYQIRAELAPYHSLSEEVSVPGPGCAVHDPRLTSENTISGKVLDHHGRPVKDAGVGLVRAGRGHSLEDEIIASAYTSGTDSGFTFTNVPLGQYLIVFNPDGPRSGKDLGLPFESTYYPGGAPRMSAKAVVLDSAGVHLTGIDLALGQRVRFRQVMVRVQFPDGVSMTTAEVECIGSLQGQGSPTWVQQTDVDKSGSARFSAPVNRALELIVRDSYGRDLKAAYRSNHDPGETPIYQEFIVIP
ncbi:MAG: carboxypeptidase-like regulatory domain-containing protein [Bryobacteraceae bacterium]